MAGALNVPHAGSALQRRTDRAAPHHRGVARPLISPRGASARIARVLRSERLVLGPGKIQRGGAGHPDVSGDISPRELKFSAKRAQNEPGTAV